MEIEVKRLYKKEGYTIGKMYIDGKYFCDTLEDKVRVLKSAADKVYGETAIPEGTYDVVITWSDKFNRKLPLLLNVPYFEGVRIHRGNYTYNRTYLKQIPKRKDKETFVSKEIIRVV